MTLPADRAIRAVAISRVDAEGRGIHLAWSGPELLVLSIDGYEVRRRRVTPSERPRRCATLDRGLLDDLERIGFLPDELGTILCRRGVWPRRLLDETNPSLPAATATDPASAGGGGTAAFAGQLLSDPCVRPGDAEIVDAPSDSSPLSGRWERLLHIHDLPGMATADDPPSGFGELAPSAIAQLVPEARRPVAMVSEQPVLVFTQELAEPADRVYVTCESQSAFVIVLSGGKAMGPESLPSATEVVLDSQAIDTVVVYAVGATLLQICADVPLEQEEVRWDQAEVLAQGLTLPLVDADPSLVDRAGELSAARARLLAAETLTNSEADRLAEALRAAAGADHLGRPCERVMVSRADLADTFQETLFSARIAILSLDPQWRRVLGLGFADSSAVDGETYEYQVRGRFPAADLLDHIYDVHTVPAGTPVPAVVHIRDLRLAFPAPTKVVLDPPPDPRSLTGVSRRGVALVPVDPLLGWVGADLLAGLCCVIDLPTATDTVVLEVADGHDLLYAGGEAGFPFLAPADPVPPGPRGELHFPAPINQLRLAGRGTLFAVRVPRGAAGFSTVHRETGPVTMSAKPLPLEPYVLAAANLQTAPAVINGPIGEQTTLPARPHPGFRVSWVPATESPPVVWPEDLAAGPPLQAVGYQIEHRRVYPGAGADSWDQIHAGGNLTFASWPSSTLAPTLEYGVDLEAVFPIHPAHAPAPPLPVGPQPPPLPGGDPPRLIGPVGVRARAILGGDRGLSAADSVLLAGHGSAILLEWGWRDVERSRDPASAEFRVYVQERVPTEVPGTITAVAGGASGWILDYATDRWLVPDECTGQWINSGGAAFRILTHTGGSSPVLTVATSVVTPSAVPLIGPSLFGRPLIAEHRRPGAWTARVGVVPLGAADTYRYVIFDAVNVDAISRTRTVWVGVSAADAESYVADEIPLAVPNGGRPGNESSVAAVAVTARYRARPTFSLPPPLGDPPEIVTDEPTGRQVRVAIDTPALLGGAVPTGARIALDRCAAAAILAITRLDGAGNVVMLRADASPQTVVFPNAGDEATVVAALQSNHPERLASRYLLFLLGHFDHPDELLQRTGGQLADAASLTDALDPNPGRWFYRVRLADSAGAVSAGGAVLPAVVRVPSTAPPPAPRRAAVEALAASIALTVDIDPDPELRWVLLFTHVTGWRTGLPDPARIQLLRTPNRRNLYPIDGIRLRLPDGTLITPVAKAVGDPDVTLRPDGALRMRISTPLAAPAPEGPPLVQYVGYGLSRDGIASRPLGPHSTGLES